MCHHTGSVSSRKRKVRFVVVAISYFEGHKEMVAQCESRIHALASRRSCDPQQVWLRTQNPLQL